MITPEDLTDLLWPAVVGGDEHRAAQVVADAIAAGTDPETVLLDVIAVVQRRIGREWAANHVGVAQEHAATAINDRLVSVATGVPAPPPRHRRVTVACVDGEWHALPARLLAEVLRLRGFRVDYLGAQVPAPHLVTHLHRTHPDVVALSSSLATRLPAAHATITACHASGTPVIAGGAAFGVDGRYARLLGADAWAPDARAAAGLLLAGLAPGPRKALLGDLADHEYTAVTTASRQLVRAVFHGLEQRIPTMRTYTDRQRQHTAEDLAHVVDFLATALYVEDEALFLDFLTWTRDILTARGVPVRFLVTALELLAGETGTLPRATGMLDAGRTHLADR